MTISVATTANTNTFAYLIARVNELADAMSTRTVTTDSNTAVGNAAISGTLTAGGLSVTSFTTVAVSSSTLSVGNTTSNVTANTTLLKVANSTQSVAIGMNSVSVGNATVNVAITPTTILVGPTSINTTAFDIGQTTLSNTGLTIGASINLTDSSLSVGGSVVNTTMISIGSVQANTTAIKNGANVVLTTSTITVGNSTVNVVANSTSVYINGSRVVVASELTDSSSATSTTGTTTQVIDSFLLSTYRAGEYVASIKNNSANAYQVSKFMVLHDGGNQYFTEFGVMQSNGAIGTFSATANATHLLVNFTPTAASTTVNFSRKLLDV